MAIDKSSTLAALVAEQPARAATLEALGLDFCCNGDRPLESAVVDADLDLAEVISALDATVGADTSTGTTAEVESMELPELLDHILETHHTYLHNELPSVRELAAKVAGVHGQNHPELVEVNDLVGSLTYELEEHMAKEEQILFPIVRDLVSGEREFHCGSVENPIRVMEHEHDAAGEILGRLREISNDYELPADACASYQALYQRLPALEHDTHMHIHKENYLVFPAAIELQHAPVSH